MSDQTVSDDLKNLVEAVLLASDTPVTVGRIQGLFGKTVRPEAAQVHDALESLQQECENRGVELKKIGSGYRYQTREKYAAYLRKLHQTKPPRMSRALLETLAIIAYRQPVTRGDIEEVRGVSVSPEIMQRLIEREWVKQIGVRDVPGRPALFGTTPEFLSYFNLGSLKELPDLMEERSLGEIAGEMDTPLPLEVLAAMEARELGETGEDSDNDGTDQEEAVRSVQSDPESIDAENSGLQETEDEDETTNFSSGTASSELDEAENKAEVELVLQQDESGTEVREARQFPTVEFDAG